MNITVTDSAKSEISSLISDLVELEDDMQLEDIAIIIYLQKASCGPSSTGGWKTPTVTVEFYKNFEKDLVLKKIENEKILNHPIFIEDDALKIFKEKENITIDAKGAIVKELFIVNAPVIDLGECHTTFSRNST